MSRRTERKPDLLDPLPFSVALLDEEGVILNTNRVWSEFGELEGMEAVFPPEGTNYLEACRQSEDQRLQRAGEGAASVLEGQRDEFEAEYPYSTSEGEHWFHLQARVFPGDGSPGVVLVQTEITDRRRSENRFRQYREIVESIQVGLIVVKQTDPGDPLGYTVKSVNPRAERMLGVPGDDVEGRGIERVYPRIGETELPELFDLVLRDNEYREKDAYRFQRPEVDDLIWDLKIFPLPQSSVGIAFEDVTQEIENRERLQYLATHDELTGLYNHRHFMEAFSEEFKRARRYEHPITVILLDLDHFKRINDRYGHLAGDRVLSTVGDLLREMTRESDVAGRYGGEEFSILLTETPLEGGREFAERLRSKIAEFEYSSNDDQTFSVTCSIGLTEISEHDERVLESLDRADRALYRAKENGRNQIHVLEPQGDG